MILDDGVNAGHAGDRTAALRVLGLLHDDQKAMALSLEALSDPKADVRAAAAYALGTMGARKAIPKLREALDDKETSVVLAAAQALVKLGDNSGYDVYYEILTGERKSKKGILGSEESKLKDPKKLAEFGFEQGIGFLPFGAVGWGAVKALTSHDPTPVRAAAAKSLSDDPDPRSGEALVQAVTDKNWIVRVAALDAIARRDDPSLVKEIVPALKDDKEAVRYTAAAAIIRLSSAPRSKATHTGD